MTQAPDPDLAAAKRARLAALLKARREAAAEGSGVEGPAADPGAASPDPRLPQDSLLSPGQERLLRLARMSPQDSFYNVIAAWRIEGPLDAARLLQAAAAMPARHAALRTSFPLGGEAQIQRIAPEAGFAAPIETLDLRAAPDPQAEADARIAADAAAPFALETAPPWRLRLMRLDETCHVLTLNMHHAISDGRSFEILANEIAALYAAAAAGGDAAALPPPPTPYAEIAARQRAARALPAAETQREAWRRLYATAPPSLALPGEDPLADPSDRSGGTVTIALPAPLIEALSARCRAEGATLFMGLLAALQATLLRAGAAEDMAICTPISGRHRAGTRDVVGYFNNILPLRLSGAGDPSLTELTVRARAAALEAFRSPDPSFEWIAALPGLRRTRLSRALFSLETPWPPPLPLEGVSCRAMILELERLDFDLAFQLWLEEGGLRGTMRFKRAMLPAPEAERLARAFEEVAALCAEAPLTPVSALPRRLAAPAAPAGADARGAGAAPAPPRTGLEARLTALWEETLEHRPIGIHDGLLQLGASSFAIAAMAERLERGFGVRLSPGDIFKAGSVAGLARMVRARTEGAGISPLGAIRAGGARPGLFLCEGMGIYFPLVAHLEPDRPVFGLVSDVVEDFPSVEELGAHYATEIRRAQPEGPYHLGGVSFGGLVAYEAARQLAAQGGRIGALALMDSPGPGAYAPYSAPGRALGHMRNLARHGLPYLRLKLKGRAGAAKSASTAREAHDEAEIRARFRKSLSGYTPGALDCDALLFMPKRRGAMEDSLFDPALGRIDPLMGWGSVVSGDVALHRLEGDHVGILREPGVAEMGACLQRAMQRAEAIAAAPV